MNDFASAYGKFDFNAGHGDVVIEAKAEKAQLTGYIKPLLRDVEVFNWQQDVENKNKSIFRSIWRPWSAAAKPCLRTRATTSSPQSGTQRQRPSARYQRARRILADFAQWIYPAFNARYERPKPDAG